MTTRQPPGHIYTLYEGNETYLETNPRLVLSVFWELSYKPALIYMVYVTLTLNIDNRVVAGLIALLPAACMPYINSFNMTRVRG